MEGLVMIAPNQRDINKTIWLMLFTGIWYYRQSTLDTQNVFCLIAHSMSSSVFVKWQNPWSHEVMIWNSWYEIPCWRILSIICTGIKDRDTFQATRGAPQDNSWIFHNANLVVDINVSCVQDIADTGLTMDTGVTYDRCWSNSSMSFSPKKKTIGLSPW